MPTTTETSASIAREYGAYLAKDIPEANCLKNEIVTTTSDYILEFLSWLSKDYCIVPKVLIRKEYEKAQKTHDIYTSATCINEMESRAIDHAEGRMCELTTLFGPQLFEEKQ